VSGQRAWGALDDLRDVLRERRPLVLQASLLRLAVRRQVVSGESESMFLTVEKVWWEWLSFPIEPIRRV
jgi:hypothetical protein